MITTSLDVIKASLRQIRVLGIGDVLSDEEAQDSLSVLNLQMESWSLDNLYIYVETLHMFQSVNGQNDYSIGPGADIDLPERPLSITSAFTQSASLSYPMKILTDAPQWDHIQNKGITVPYPSYAWYEQTFPLGTLHFYPAPAGDMTGVRFRQQLQSFPNLTTEIELPVGYKHFMVYNLSPALAGEFGIAVPASVLQEARSSMARIKRFNHRTYGVGSEAASMNRNNNTNSYNILSDNY
jgi:hypothetical protein